MSLELTVYALVIVGVLCWVAFSVGVNWGKAVQVRNLGPLTDAAHRYRMAVNDVDKWCAHLSPHAKLIAAHIKAHGDGDSYNGGTPVRDEPCSISGLRQQLATLDARIAADGEQKSGGTA